MYLWFVTYTLGNIKGADQPVITGDGDVDSVRSAIRLFHEVNDLRDSVEIHKAVLVGPVAYHGIRLD